MKERFAHMALLQSITFEMKLKDCQQFFLSDAN